MKYSVMLLCMAATLSVSAQNTLGTDSILKRYNEQTLHYNHGYISKGENGPRLRGAALKAEFATSPLAQETFAVSRRAQTVGTILAGTALACLITGRIIDRSSPYLYSSSRHNMTNGLFIGFIATYTASIPFLIRSHKKRNYAIWVRNRDVLVR